MGKGVAGSIQRLMHFFLPKEESFFPVFEAMALQARDGALLLQRVMHGEVAATDSMTPIAELEHAVDKMRHDCVNRLNETFVTPIMLDRQDILDLGLALDDVVDYTRAAIDRMALYQVAHIPEAARALADILVECTIQLAGLCRDLPSLRSADHAAIEHTNTLENRGDSVLKQGLADLFLGGADPVEIIKWKEIYDYLEEAIDHCEDTVQCIEAALVKNS